ncbi:MAG: metallopeptidase family protein [Maricaulaceae bacterium]
MTETFAPSLDDIAGIAQAAFARLPEPFQSLCAQIVIRVDEFAEDAVLAELGIESPFDLSGLYQGVDLSQMSVQHSGLPPNQIRLYRRSLLDEWCERGDIALERLVAHVLIHEIGHHFGLSDADMERIERAAG